MINKDSIVKPLPSIELIRKQEKFWRVQLPKDFVDFIMQNNGTILSNAQFMLNNRSYKVDRFLCIIDDIENHPMGIYDIDVIVTQIGERLTANEDLLGVEVLPIAAVFAGDFVCLDFRSNPTNPSICVWSHEESYDFEPTLYDVSNNFIEFLELIRN